MLGGFGDMRDLHASSCRSRASGVPLLNPLPPRSLEVEQTLLNSPFPCLPPPSEVDRGWSAGDCSGRYLEGHNDHIRCAQLEGSTLVTASGSMSHTDCSIRYVSGGREGEGGGG